MSRRICICCGEPMEEKGNTLSRNPNICASCSSLTDGINETKAGSSTGAADIVPTPEESSIKVEIVASKPPKQPRRTRPRA